MGLTLVSPEDMQTGRKKVIANCHIGNEIIMDNTKMISFDKPLTYSDVKYKLLKVGIWSHHMSKPTKSVGIEGAIDLTITDKKDGQVFKSIMYYTPDLQIRNGLQSFFPKYITDISDLIDNDLKNLTDVQNVVGKMIKIQNFAAIVVSNLDNTLIRTNGIIVTRLTTLKIALMLH
jgi:hypothetical protein